MIFAYTLLHWETKRRQFPSKKSCGTISDSMGLGRSFFVFVPIFAHLADGLKLFLFSKARKHGFRIMNRLRVNGTTYKRTPTQTDHGNHTTLQEMRQSRPPSPNEDHQIPKACWTAGNAEERLKRPRRDHRSKAQVVELQLGWAVQRFSAMNKWMNSHSIPQ